MKDGNEFRDWARAEAIKSGRGCGGKELENLKTSAAICYQSKLAGAHHTNLDIVRLLQLAIGIEKLFQGRMLRTLNVDDGHALLACCHVGIGPGHGNISGISNR